MTLTDPTFDVAQQPMQVVEPTIFDPMREMLDRFLINRATETDMFFLALIARCHVFMLGEPGTGKSFLTNLFQTHVKGATRYTALFTKSAGDDLLFGPWDLTALTEGRRVRSSRGRYLQDATIAFFDEAWKGSSTLVNALLKILNERTFDDDGIEVLVPLCMAILASNELPQQEHKELEAIYDRIDIRLVVEPLTDPGDLELLLNLPPAPKNPAPLLDWADVEAAQHAAAAIPVSDEAKDALIKIVVALNAEGIQPSGRRIASTMRLAKAAAWLAGADKVEPGHLDFLVHTMWSDPKQRATVNRIVLDDVAPLRGQAVRLSDDVAGLHDDLHDAMALEDADPQRNAIGTEIMNRLKESAREVITLEAQIAPGSRDAIALEDTGRRIDALSNQVQRDIYGFPTAQSLVHLARTGQL